MTLPAAICSGFLLALFAPALHRRLGDRAGKAFALLPLGLFVGFAALAPYVASGRTFVAELPWIPSLGIAFAFRVDGLSLLFLLIISGVAVFISLFAGDYLSGDRNRGRFFAYLFSFMAAMLGVVAADDAILLFIFWELTSLTSFLLIGHSNEREESRRSALQALLVTAAGGLALLAGLILLGHAAGTFRISEMAAAGPEIAEHPMAPAILVLVLMGAFTKSAQFPFHFWLPNAMAAPAPVSAFLHSATMVKAGVFLLARLYPALHDFALWAPIVAPVGAATFLIGVFMGLGQTDLKRLLAYSTLSVLGLLTFMLGLDSAYAVRAMVTYLIAHALYKAALFIAAGTVDHECGARDVTALGGLRRAMPRTAAGAAVGGLSMAGIPLFFGFIGKEYFYKAALNAPASPALWTAVAVLGSMPMVALGLLGGLKPHFGELRETPKHPHEGPWPMWIGPAALGVLTLAFGLFPGFAGHYAVGPAVDAILGHRGFDVHLHLWSGFTPALGLSAITVAGGLVLFASAGRAHAIGRGMAGLARAGPEAAYFALLRGLVAVAKASSRTLQFGYLRFYILISIGFLLLLFFLRSPVPFLDLSPGQWESARLVDALVCASLLAGAVAACVSRTRLVAIAALGVTGAGVALIFALHSAPDLAITQFLVETLTVLLFLFAFARMPLLKELNSRRSRLCEAGIAAAFGAFMGTLALVAESHQIAPSISGFFLENSYTQAQGKNIVNVILVDFRALDTLGEITVLAIAGLSIAALIQLTGDAGSEDDKP